MDNSNLPNIDEQQRQYPSDYNNSHLHMMDSPIPSSNLCLKSWYQLDMEREYQYRYRFKYYAFRFRYKLSKSETIETIGDIHTLDNNDLEDISHLIECRSHMYLQYSLHDKSSHHSRMELIQSYHLHRNIRPYNYL